MARKAAGKRPRTCCIIQVLRKIAKAPADIQHLLEAADNHGMVS
jgi:hypothetical protein